MLQWMGSGVAREVGADLSDAVAQRDDEIERLLGEDLEVLRGATAQVDAVLVSHHPDGVGVQGLGVAAHAGGVDRAAERTWTSASAICDRALLPVQRKSTPRGGQLVGGPRLGDHPQAGVERPAGGRQHRAEAGAGRRGSRRHGRRPSCAARSPGRRRAACAGGTRRGSGARPPRRSDPAPSGRCERDPPGAASGAGARRSGGTPGGSGRAGRWSSPLSVSISFDGSSEIVGVHRAPT